MSLRPSKQNSLLKLDKLDLDHQTEVRFQNKLISQSIVRNLDYKLPKRQKLNKLLKPHMSRSRQTALHAPGAKD